MIGHRSIHTRRNPNGRGFVVEVLECVARHEKHGVTELRCVASQEAGTRNKARKIAADMRAEFITAREA